MSIFWRQMRREEQIRGDTWSVLPCFANRVLPLRPHPWNGELRGKPPWGYSLFRQHRNNQLTMRYDSFFMRLHPLPMSYCVSYVIFLSLFPHFCSLHTRTWQKSRGKVVGGNKTRWDGARCRDEGVENKTNREPCTKGNEAKRKGAAEGSVITR